MCHDRISRCSVEALCSQVTLRPCNTTSLGRRTLSCIHRTSASSPRDIFSRNSVEPGGTQHSTWPAFALSQGSPPRREEPRSPAHVIETSDPLLNTASETAVSPGGFPAFSQGRHEQVPAAPNRQLIGRLRTPVHPARASCPGTGEIQIAYQACRATYGQAPGEQRTNRCRNRTAVSRLS